jgi:uncharacterized protein (UPF0254 family)
MALSDLAREQLLRVARWMFKKDKRVAKIMHDDIQGRVHTDGEHTTMAGISGQVFEAQVIAANGNTEVRFMVRDVDLDDQQFEEILEKGEWQFSKDK